MSTPNPVEVVKTCGSSYLNLLEWCFHCSLPMWCCHFFRSFDFRPLAVSANNGPWGVLPQEFQELQGLIQENSCTRLRRIFSWRQIAVSGWPLLNLAKAPENGGVDRPWSFNRKWHSCHLTLGCALQVSSWTLQLRKVLWWWKLYQYAEPLINFDHRRRPSTSSLSPRWLWWRTAVSRWSRVEFFGIPEIRSKRRYGKMPKRMGGLLASLNMWTFTKVFETIAVPQICHCCLSGCKCCTSPVMFNSACCQIFPASVETCCSFETLYQQHAEGATLLPSLRQNWSNQNPGPLVKIKILK